MKAKPIQSVEINDNGMLNGALSLIISALIVKILGVIYKMPLARILGEEGMGYFNSAYTVYSVFYLLCTAGVPKAVTMVVLDVKNKFADSHLTRIILRVFFVIGSALTLMLVVFSGRLAEITGNAKSAVTILAVAPSILFASLAGVLRGYLNARLDFLSVSVSQIIEGVLKLALGLILAGASIRMQLPLHMTSAFTVLGISISTFIACLYLYFVSKIRVSTDKTGQKSVRGVIKSVFKISLPITLSALIMSLSSFIDLLMIINRLCVIGFTSEEATAVYGSYTTSTVSVFNLLLSVVTPVSVAAFPKLVKHKENFNRSGMINEASKTLELSAIISAPIIIGTYFYSEEIISLLFGDSFAVGNGYLLRTLIGAGFFASLLLITNSMLEALGKLHVPIVAMTIGCVIKTFFGYFAISDPEIGILGAPLGTLLCYVFALIVSIVYLTFVCKISLPIFKTNALPYLSAFVAVLSSYSVYVNLPRETGNKLPFLISIIISAIIYFMLSIFTGALKISKNDKKRIEIKLFNRDLCN